MEAYWAEDDDEGNVEIEVDGVNENVTPEISLHAMAGVQAPKTMRIWVSLQGHSVIVLIDSRSTHNFINSQVTQHANLCPNSNGRLEVMVASGQQLVSPGKCTQVYLKLQKIPFVTDFFVLPLEGYDVVLGTKWLRMLGSIEWDFEKLFMKFTWNDKEVVLCGINSTGKVLDATPISKLNKQQQRVTLHALDVTSPSTKPDHIPPPIKDLLLSYQEI